MIEAANQVCFWGGAWKSTYYRGIPVFKYPEDLWTYQEIITEVWPTLIIETGTAQGGSAVYFQDLLDILPATNPRRRVITVDNLPAVATHDTRIRYIVGSSLDPRVVAKIRGQVTPEDRVMVILDSEHLMDHVYQELELYADLVSLGHYLVTEDTFISRFHCEGDRFRGGSTWEAVQKWLPDHPEFQRDERRDKFMLTMNPGGWFRREL